MFYKIIDDPVLILYEKLNLNKSSLVCVEECINVNGEPEESMRDVLSAQRER